MLKFYLQIKTKHKVELTQTDFRYLVINQINGQIEFLYALDP